jgi:hypothetical protein
MFDLPAMPLNWCEVNLIIVIHNSMITLTQHTMHGRRVFISFFFNFQSSIFNSGLSGLGKPGENQVSCQMKCNAVALMAFAHFCRRNEGIPIRIKSGIGPVYGIEGFKK